MARIDSLKDRMIKERNYWFLQDPVASSNKECLEILKQKQINRPFVLKRIDQIINAKKSIFSSPFCKKSVCLIGHSQLDQWQVDVLAGYKVRNCSVSGITSFEYNEKILNNGLLNCNANCFIVMHGTNDVVWDYNISEIVDSIQITIEYIRQRNEKAPIIFLSCLHVNGRFDRSNTRIDELNSQLFLALNAEVIWLDTTFMDNIKGALDENYTTDGLHLTNAGYGMLQNSIEEKMKEIGL